HLAFQRRLEEALPGVVSGLLELGAEGGGGVVAAAEGEAPKDGLGLNLNADVEEAFALAAANGEVAVRGDVSDSFVEGEVIAKLGGLLFFLGIDGGGEAPGLEHGVADEGAGSGGLGELLGDDVAGAL